MAFFDVLCEIFDGKKSDILSEVHNGQEIRKSKKPIEPGETIRCSSLSKFCPRAEAIRFSKKLTVEEVFEPQTARLFKFGRQFELFLRDFHLGRKGVVIGKWACLFCHHMPESVGGDARYPMPKLCEKCGSEEGIRRMKAGEEDVLFFRYVEEFRKDQSSCIGGSTDGFIYWNSDYAILEMKTINDNGFRRVKREGPQYSHVCQANAYMKLHGYKKAIIWYHNKNTSEEAVFWIDFDQQLSKALFDRGLAYQEWHKTGLMPSRICPNNTCEMAGRCAVVGPCFGEVP